MTTRRGITLEIKTPGDWYILKEIFINCEYDAAIRMALDALATDSHMRVLDIGANTGFFALRVLELAREAASCQSLEIIAVEGDPETYHDLHTRLKKFPEQGQSITPVFGLVGDRSGFGSIHHSEFSPTSSVFGVSNGSSVEVSYVDLEPLVDAEIIDLLKCDIEGAEEQFISNYPEILARTKVAVFEIHGRRCNASRCLDLLVDSGLRVRYERNTGDGTSLVVLHR